MLRWSSGFVFPSQALASLRDHGVPDVHGTTIASMPASRSRTAEWKRSMQQIFERGGTLEVAVAAVDAERGGDLVWRLKIVSLEEESVIVEAPVMLGKHIRIESGVPLLGAITIGQNRWKFKTEKLEDCSVGGARVSALRLRLPDAVERCMRRFPRYEAGGLRLPPVRLWPLRDPRSVVAAEEASDAAWATMRSAAQIGAAVPTVSALPMPQVGPEFSAVLVNIGGGGAGIRVESADAAALGHHRVFWLHISLGALLPLPICVTGKLVHTHLDSSQRTYAGLSFDFTFHLPHQQAVADQVAHAMRSAQASMAPAPEP
jgi:hypothetical protein